MLVGRFRAGLPSLRRGRGALLRLGGGNGSGCALRGTRCASDRLAALRRLVSLAPTKVAHHRHPRLRRRTGFRQIVCGPNEPRNVVLAPVQRSVRIGLRSSDAAELRSTRRGAWDEAASRALLPFRGTPRNSARGLRSQTSGRRGPARRGAFGRGGRTNTWQLVTAPPRRRRADDHEGSAGRSRAAMEEESASGSHGQSPRSGTHAAAVSNGSCLRLCSLPARRAPSQRGGYSTRGSCSRAGLNAGPCSPPCRTTSRTASSAVPR